jgi:hypothetical protein
MFDIERLDEIIATRRLYLDGDPDVTVQILLGRPQASPISSNDGFMLCPYQILGIGDQKVRCAGGVDAFQALQLAMEMIGSELYIKLNPRHDGKLRWEAGEANDLGFPSPSILRDQT